MQLKVNVSTADTDTNPPSVPFPLSMPVELYEGDNGAALERATWVTTFSGINSKTAVLYYDGTNSGLAPGLYINEESSWKFAIPYSPYLANYVISGGSATLYYNITKPEPVPEKALVFKDGVGTSANEIPAGNGLWATLVVGADVSIPVASDITLGGIITSADITVVGGQGTEVTKKQATARLIRVYGDIGSNDTWIRVPDGSTGIWIMENNVKGTATLWIQLDSQNTGNPVPAGQNAILYVSKDENNQPLLTVYPFVLSVAGKTGKVTLDVGDVSGAAPVESPTFSGQVKAEDGYVPDSDNSLVPKNYVDTAIAKVSKTYILPLSYIINAQNFSGYSQVIPFKCKLPANCAGTIASSYSDAPTIDTPTRIYRWPNDRPVGLDDDGIQIGSMTHLGNQNNSTGFTFSSTETIFNPGDVLTFKTYPSDNEYGRLDVAFTLAVVLELVD